MLRTRLVQVLLAAGFALLAIASIDTLIDLPNAWAKSSLYPYRTRDAVFGGTTAVLALIACPIGFALIMRAARRPGALAIAGLLFALHFFLASERLWLPLIRVLWRLSLRAGSAFVVQSVIHALAAGLVIGFFIRLSQQFRPMLPLREPADEPAEGSIAGALMRSALRHGYVMWPLVLAFPVAVHFLTTDAIVALREQLILLVAPRETELSVGNYYMLFVAKTGFDVAAIAQTAVYVVAWCALAAVIAFCLVELTSAFANAQLPDRRRLAWILIPIAAILLTVCASLALRLAPLPPNANYVVARVSAAMPLFLAALFTVSMAGAVFGAGVVDSDLVLRRTTLYGATAVVGLFVFAGIENVMAAYVARRLGWSESVGIWISAGCAALALNPIREWLRARTKQSPLQEVPPIVTDAIDSDEAQPLRSS